MSTIKVSTSFKIFRNTIHRALNLLTLRKNIIQLTSQQGKSKSASKLKGIENLDIDDLTRTSLVIAVAAMDSYVTGVFLEKLEFYLKHTPKIPKRMLEFLEKAGVNLEVCLELFKDRNKYKRIRSLLDSKFSRFTVQNFKTIDDLISAYGFADFSKNIEKSMKNQNARRIIAGIILRRHKIVHEGDISATGKLCSIDHDDIQTGIETLYSFIAHFEKVFYNGIDYRLRNKHHVNSKDRRKK